MSDLNQKNSDNTSDNKTDKPSELVIGLLTFIAFVVFMSVWMYFSS